MRYEILKSPAYLKLIFGQNNFTLINILCIRTEELSFKNENLLQGNINEF